MIERSHKIAALVARNFLGLFAFSFLLLVAVSFWFAFTLEDRILENQVSRKADEIASMQSGEFDHGVSVAGLEMIVSRGSDDLPVGLADRIAPDWPDGEFEVVTERADRFHVAVRSLDDGEKLYVALDASPYSEASRNASAFLVVTALVALLLLLVARLFLSRMTQKVTKPVEALALAASRDDPIDATLSSGIVVPSEIRALADALQRRDRRIEKLLEREAIFNRHVSHELRTPLTIALGASEIIERQVGDSAATNRLIGALSDMQQLTEGVLWLGRAPDSFDRSDPVLVCREAVKAERIWLVERPVAVSIEGSSRSPMPIPYPVAQVIVRNLLRNAFRFTKEGHVALVVSDGRLAVADSGVGFGNASQDEQGFGLGISLVQRLCDHFRLTLEIVPSEGRGTIASISWRDPTE